MSEMTPTGGLDAITLRNVFPGAFGLTLLGSATLAAAPAAFANLTRINSGAFKRE